MVEWMALAMAALLVEKKEILMADWTDEQLDALTVGKMVVLLELLRDCS